MFEDLSRPPLRESELRSALVEGPLADYSALDVVPELGSSNAELLERARAGAGDKTALLAEYQWRGRGRLGRSWTAPAGSQIALSVLIRPGVVHPDLFGWLPLVTGLAVRDALAEHAGLAASLKWPNDVLVDAAGAGVTQARKLAGILVEMILLPAEGVYSMSLPAIVVGVGLNVSLRPEELPVPTATSVDIERTARGEGEPANRTILAKELLRALSVRHEQWRACERGSSSVISEELYREYQEACSTIGQTVRVEFPDGSELLGVAETVDRSGELVVRDASGEAVHVAAGDVHHVRSGAAEEN
ncbi:biotin--[acetyl-CoA-carboxylase] ligase [Dietzia sp.]|uniref:biotin--[acetyl-CoA-carboxylase] ligase n=1 Tax=Dietzia sp. TaxID=1871616 RepID=UPI002FD94B5B